MLKVFGILFLLFSLKSHAQRTGRSYTVRDIQMVQKAGANFSLFFDSPRCKECKKIRKFIQELKFEKRLRKSLILIANFDQSAPLRTFLRVQKPGTIIRFRGRFEKTRTSRKFDKLSLMRFITSP